MNVDLAAFVPDIAPDEYVALVADIAARGLTYGLAALGLGREFIGVEADAGRFALAVGGLEAVAS
jgi:hypothetical protein